MKKEGGRTSMNFHISMKKLKNNMLSLFLAIAVSLTTLPYTTAPLLIYADNAGGGGSSGGTAENVGGASDSRCGYRMYVVDKNGNLLSNQTSIYKHHLFHLKNFPIASQKHPTHPLNQPTSLTGYFLSIVNQT